MSQSWNFSNSSELKEVGRSSLPGKYFDNHSKKPNKRFEMRRPSYERGTGLNKK